MRDSVSKTDMKMTCIFSRNFLTPPFWPGATGRDGTRGCSGPDSAFRRVWGSGPSAVLVPVTQHFLLLVLVAGLSIFERGREVAENSQEGQILEQDFWMGYLFYPQRSGKKSLETWLICYLSLGLYIEEVIEVIPILSTSSSHPLLQIFSKTPGPQGLGLKPPHQHFLWQDLP